jgi:hypothetical protein
VYVCACAYCVHPQTPHSVIPLLCANVAYPILCAWLPPCTIVHKDNDSHPNNNIVAFLYLYLLFCICIVLYPCFKVVLVQSCLHVGACMRAFRVHFPDRVIPFFVYKPVYSCVSLPFVVCLLPCTIVYKDNFPYNKSGTLLAGSVRFIRVFYVLRFQNGVGAESL